MKAKSDEFEFEETEDPYMEIDGEEVKEEALIYDEMAPNLVPTFAASREGQAALKKIASQVCKDFESAWDSSEQYRERTQKDWALFTGELPEKSFPFDSCSNLHVPLMIENATRLVTRMEGEVFGDWKSVFNVMPIHQDDATARLLTKHGNWQLRNQITDFRRQATRSLMNYIVPGDFTWASFYDPVKKKNRHEV
jgi:hypothetical protein